MKATERRRAPRARDYHLIAYTHYDEQGNVDDEGIARTLDASEKGIRLETSRPMSPGSRLALKIQIGKDILDLQGRVVYSNQLPNGRFRIGLSLQDVPQALMAQIEWQLGLQAIVAQAVERVGAKGGGILLGRPVDDELQVVLSYDLELDSAAFQECESLAATVLARERPAVVLEPHACIAVPIPAGNRSLAVGSLGVLVLVADAPHVFSAEDMALLDGFAVQIAAALGEATPRASPET